MAPATYRPPLCDWDTPDNPTFNTWTTINIGEVFPGVAHPFDASWWEKAHYHIFSGMCERLGISDLVPIYAQPIPNFLAYWAGRGALNVAFTAAIAASYQVGEGSGAVEQFFTASEKGAHRVAAPVDLARAKRTRQRLFRMLGQMPRSAEADRQKARGFERRVRGLDLGGMSAAALRREIAHAERLLHRAFDHHIILSFGGGGESASALDQFLRSHIPDLEADAQIRLTSALGGVESAQPAHELWAMARWVGSKPELRREVPHLSPDAIRERLAAPSGATWRAFAQRMRGFLEAYGFRGPSEWMLSTPDWSENPAFALNSLRNMVDAPDEQSPAQHEKRAAAGRTAAEAEYRTRLPANARSTYEALLRQTQDYVRMRESTKATCIIGLRPGRPLFLEIGRRLVQRGLLEDAQDLFLLRYEEVERAVEEGLAPAETQAIVERRRAQYRARLTGLGVSPGVASGPARVVMTAEAAGEVTIEPGEVLVAPYTDAPWTPLFLTASAVVVEQGGLLSHAATVAREFGIPAVVMVKDATRLIKTGEHLTVDGRAGEVRVGGAS